MRQTNINTFIVQLIQFLPILILVFEMIDPAPALAFSNQLSGPTLIFTAPVTDASNIPTSLQKGILLHVTASAYTSEASLTDSSPSITASGAHARYGIIATNILPLFTTVRIGSEVFTVEDRMNSRYDHSMSIDIWLPTLEEASNFGIRTMDIEIQSLPDK